MKTGSRTKGWGVIKKKDNTEGWDVITKTIQRDGM